MNTVRRIFVEKKPGFDVEARRLLTDLRDNLNLSGLTGVRVLQRYDVQGVSDEAFAAAKTTIFSEPPVDTVYDETYPAKADTRVFITAFLPGQYDQQADSAAECVQLLTQQNRPQIAVAHVIELAGQMTDAEFEAVKKYYINPVEAHEVSAEKPESLDATVVLPPDVATVEGFITLDEAALSEIE